MNRSKNDIIVKQGKLPEPIIKDGNALTEEEIKAFLAWLVQEGYLIEFNDEE